MPDAARRRRWWRKPKPKLLRVAVEDIGNATVITGTRDPLVVKAEIVLGSADPWLDVMQAGGRLTVRTSAIIGAWIEGEDGAYAR